MSLIDTLLGNVKTYAEAFEATDITTDEMSAAIKQWYDLYFNTEKTEKSDPCQQIPFTIVRRLTKATFSEYKGTSKDKFADKVLSDLHKSKKDTGALQKALVGGLCGIKPVPAGDHFTFVLLPRPNIIIFGRDADGNPNDIGTSEKTASKGKYYTLLERRTVDDDGYLTIINKLYQSNSAEELGRQVPLKTLPQYEDLADEYKYPDPIFSLGIAMVTNPALNCVDGSEDPVSVYAKAAGLIENINLNEAQINGEFERGESRIMVSNDWLKGTKDHKELTDHVFTAFEDDPETIGMQIFAPAFREQSYYARKKEYLIACENVIGLKRGLLSNEEAVERTATEITSSEGDYNLTIIDFQEAMETAIKELVRLCGIFGKLYSVTDAHEVEEEQVTIDWGNGVLYDREAKNNELLTMVSAGLLKPEIYLGWYYDVPHETEAEIAKIRKDYMPELEKLMEGEEQ